MDEQIPSLFRLFQTACQCMAKSRVHDNAGVWLTCCGTKRKSQSTASGRAATRRGEAKDDRGGIGVALDAQGMGNAGRVII